MSSRQPAAGSGDAGLRLPDGAFRILVVFLLVALAMAGLRGAISAPEWDGPLHRDGLAVGAVFEVALIALLVLTIIRRARQGAGSDKGLAVKLRIVLTYVLSLGIAAVAVLMVIGLHLHLFTSKARPLRPPPQPARQPSRRPGPHGIAGSKAYVIPLDIILYGLLGVLAIAAIVLAVRYGSRLRLPAPRADGEIARDEPGADELREAVTSGREALLAIDDARAAIIACYLAMERTLAGHGAVRTDADTPDELLARASTAGLVTGTAAARLTGLFYEARFSVHPVEAGQRAAAERALTDLAGELARAAGPLAQEAGG